MHFIFNIKYLCLNLSYDFHFYNESYNYTFCNAFHLHTTILKHILFFIELYGKEYVCDKHVSVKGKHGGLLDPDR